MAIYEVQFAMDCFSVARFAMTMRNNDETPARTVTTTTPSPSSKAFVMTVRGNVVIASHESGVAIHNNYAKNILFFTVSLLIASQAVKAGCLANETLRPYETVCLDFGMITR